MTLAQSPGVSDRHCGQAHHAGILESGMFDRGMGVRELPIEGAHEGEQRGDDRAQAAGQGKALTPEDKMLRTAGGHAVIDHADRGRVLEDTRQR